MIKKMAAQLVKDMKDDGGIRQIYFVACGGSLGAFYPSKIFVETEAQDIKCGYYTSNEFVHNPPKSLGKNSVVIACSHGGNTPETVNGSKLAQQRGAKTVCFTFEEGSELTQYADQVVLYEFGDDRNLAKEKPALGLELVVEILNQTEGYEYYNEFQDGLSKIHDIIHYGSKVVKERALAFAKKYRNENIIYTMGSGTAYGAAYMQSICIFMEMQWINSSSINSGEYFHGPFEITDKTLPFMMFVSEGKTRALDERALKFLKQYGEKIEVLDAKELGLSTISEKVIDYFNFALFNDVAVVYNRAMAEERKHPLSSRRYMWKLQY